MNSLLISQLPNDIQMYILTFTYQPQPIQLLNDIHSFHKYASVIHNMYQTYLKMLVSRGMTLNPSDTELYYMSWFHVDLFGYCKFIKTYNDCNYPLFCLFMRNSQIKTSSHAYRYFRRTFDNKPQKSKCQILWGLLNPAERFKFIAHLKNSVNARITALRRVDHLFL